SLPEVQEPGGAATVRPRAQSRPPAMKFLSRACAGRLRWLFPVFVLGLWLCQSLQASLPSGNPVLLLTINGHIDPLQSRYLKRGLDEAVRVRASCVVLQID